MSTPLNITESDYLPNLVLKICTATFAIFGLPANLIVLILIGNKLLKRKPYEWLLFNLALVDFCHCLNNLCLQVPFIGQYDTMPCKVSGFLQYITGFQTFLLPPIIAYNRYLSLYNSYKCSLVFTPFKTACMCVCTWIFSTALWCPFAINGDLGEDDLGMCGLLRKQHGHILQCCPGYIFLLTFARIIIGLCYCTLFLSTYKIIHRLRSHQAASPSVQSRLMDESKELVTLTSLIFLIPFLTQSPAMTAKMALLYAPYIDLDAWYTTALIVPFAFPAAIDPYMTLYVVKDYRRKVANCFKRN